MITVNNRILEIDIFEFELSNYLDCLGNYLFISQINQKYFVVKRIGSTITSFYADNKDDIIMDHRITISIQYMYSFNFNQMTKIRLEIWCANDHEYIRAKLFS